MPEQWCGKKLMANVLKIFQKELLVWIRKRYFIYFDAELLVFFLIFFLFNFKPYSDTPFIPWKLKKNKDLNRLNYKFAGETINIAAFGELPLPAYLFSVQMVHLHFLVTFYLVPRDLCKVYEHFTQEKYFKSFLIIHWNLLIDIAISSRLSITALDCSYTTLYCFARCHLLVLSYVNWNLCWTGVYWRKI